MLIVHQDLKPVLCCAVLIKEYNDIFELIVVEIITQNTLMRVITGYGPQENLRDEGKMPFWVAFEEEVASSDINGRSVIVQMDANAKLGPKYVNKDPKIMSGNGRMLAGIMERHVLTVINGLQDKCNGTITRQETQPIILRRV